MPFYGIKNLRAAATETVERPWEWTGDDLSRFASKEQVKKWSYDVTTEHRFLSAYEGVTSTVRISGEEQTQNCPCRMWGIIADYDGNNPVEARIEEAQANPPSEYRPAYMYQSYRGMHAVWLFEDGIYLPDHPPFVRRFLEIANKHIQLRAWGISPDEEAFYAPHTYYRQAGAWRPVFPTYRISKDMLHLWLFEASKRVRLVDATYEIPLDRVYAEIEARWPGRWKTPFALGSRGLRVWDASAKDETACWVTKDGFYVHNADPKPFMSWRDVFEYDKGDRPNFVAQFEAERTGSIISRFRYVNSPGTGKPYWFEATPGFWVDHNVEDMKRTLRLAGLSDHIPKGKTYSEIDEIMSLVILQQRVDGARPVLFYPPGIVSIGAEKVINTCSVRVLPPAPPGEIFGLADLQKFAPMFWEFMDTFFDDPPGASITQMHWVLAWMKRFYVGAYHLKPDQGQALVLVGPEGVGKTFFIDRILGGLYGGVYDANKFIVQGNKWTGYVYYPVAKLDDARKGKSNSDVILMNERIKAIVANPLHGLEMKYGNEVMTLWPGRLVIGLNEDPESMRGLPTVEISNKSKLSLTKVRRPTTDFDSHQDINNARIAAELPYVARFLLEWHIPEEMLNREDPRYLLRAYHHPALFTEAVHAGPAEGCSELLYIWGYTYLQRHPEAQEWCGTASELLSSWSECGMSAILFKDYNPQRVGKEMSMLSARNSYITRVAMLNGHHRIKIDFGMFRPEDVLPIVKRKDTIDRLLETE